MIKKIFRVFRMPLKECVVLLLAVGVAVAIGGVVKKEIIDKREENKKAALEQLLQSGHRPMTDKEIKDRDIRMRFERIGIATVVNARKKRDADAKEAAAIKPNKVVSEIVSEGF